MILLAMGTWDDHHERKLKSDAKQPGWTLSDKFRVEHILSSGLWIPFSHFPLAALTTMAWVLVH